MSRSAPPAAGEFYGSVPSFEDAPDELPAGTKTKGIISPSLPLRKERKTNLKHGYGYGHDTAGLWFADQIDWTTVKRPPAPPAPESMPEDGFRVGDRVTWDEGDGKLRTGSFKRKSDHSDDLVVLPDDGCCWNDHHEKGTRGWYVNRRWLRPASPHRDETTTAAGSAEELDHECTVCGKAMRKMDRYQNPSRNQYGTCRECHFAEPPADPYAIVRDERRHNEANIMGPFVDGCARGRRMEDLRASDHPLDQLAAHRLRLAARREEGGREREGKRHASDWDVSDAPECYSTSGWSGR